MCGCAGAWCRRVVCHPPSSASRLTLFTSPRPHTNAGYSASTIPEDNKDLTFEGPLHDVAVIKLAQVRLCCCGLPCGLLLACLCAMRLARAWLAACVPALRGSERITPCPYHSPTLLRAPQAVPGAPTVSLASASTQLREREKLQVSGWGTTEDGQASNQLK